MEELFNLELSNETINSMLELNPYIKEINKYEIIEKENILESLGYTKNEISNIISSNPLYLNRTNKEILELIKYLKDIGFNSLNTLFDANPYILNLEIFEIENYLNKRKQNELLENIIDDLESNPYLFNEI